MCSMMMAVVAVYIILIPTVLQTFPRKFPLFMSFFAETFPALLIRLVIHPVMMGLLIISYRWPFQFWSKMRPFSEWALLLDVFLVYHVAGRVLVMNSGPLSSIILVSAITAIEEIVWRLSANVRDDILAWIMGTCGMSIKVSRIISGT